MCNIQWQDIGGISVAINDDHRFGTDAVLLENFALSSPAKRVCDFGTGCGIIPLLICKRERKPQIFAVEIQKDAADLLKTSVEKNKIENVRVICGDVKDKMLLHNEMTNGSLDLITCNPPYYKENSGVKSPNESRAVCREENSLNIYEASEAAARLLKFGGRFCICHKPERLCDCIDAMRKNAIEPKRIRFVHKTEDDKPWLVLIEGKRGAAPFLEVMPPLVINSEKGQEEIKSIYSGCE